MKIRSLIASVLSATALAAIASASQPAAAPSRFSVDVPTEPTPPAQKALAAPASPVAPRPVPPPARPGVTLPKNLEGVVTAAEFEKYLNFQAGLREHAEVKALTDKIQALIEQIRPLQARLDLVRANASAANPEVKAIADRINAAMTASPKARK